MRRQMDADQLTGYAIMAAREYRGLTINELADLLGWHRNTLSRCEDGARHVREVELLGIATLLDWPVEALRTPLLPDSVASANLTSRSTADPGLRFRAPAFPSEALTFGTFGTHRSPAYN